MSFDIEQAKKQVEAVEKLAMPYFLDACDEIEKLRAALTYYAKHGTGRAKAREALAGSDEPFPGYGSSIDTPN